MKSIRLHYRACILFMILLASLLACEEAEGPSILPPAVTEPVPRPGDDDTNGAIPDAEMKLPSLVIQLAKVQEITPVEARLQSSTKARITILYADGSPTSYTLSEIAIQDMGDHYLTEPIRLPEGSYQVVAFFVVNDADAVVEATPKRGSSFVEDPEQALPLPFLVEMIETPSGEEPELMLPLQVFAAAEMHPSDFGYQSFGLTVVSPPTYRFYIAMVSDQRLLDFMPGQMEVRVNGQSLFQELSAGINESMALPVAEHYWIGVKSFNREDYAVLLTFEELQMYSSEPLILEMEVAAILCTGGDFPDALTVNTQTELVNWAKRCHTGIGGDLTIQCIGGNDPIVDLSPLELVTHVHGDLTVLNISKLKNLHGLHHMEYLEGSIAIRNNRGLESLEGISMGEERKPFLTIQDNPLLVDLKGLENVYEAGYVDISSNAKLINFSGLDQLQEVIDLRVAFNVSQTSFEGLRNLRRVSSLEISGIGITNFDGLQALETIGGLSLYSLNKLSDFTGLNAVVGFSVDFIGTSVKSLEGLRVADQLTSLNLSDNYYLSNLRGLSNLKQVKRRLYVEDNMSLTSLAGLENLVLVGVDGAVSYTMYIRSNGYLTDFCALTHLFTDGSYHEADIRWNAYNPTVEQVMEGECKEDW